MIAFGLGDEPLHRQASDILSVWQKNTEHLTAPQLFRSEITAVVRKIVYQQRITAAQGRVMLSRLLMYPVEFHEDDDLLKDAYELAVRFNRPRAYDTQYLALAARLNCGFWTADERLFNAVRHEFTNIFWLGSWQSNG